MCPKVRLETCLSAQYLKKSRGFPLIIVLEFWTENLFLPKFLPTLFLPKTSAITVGRNTEGLATLPHCAAGPTLPPTIPGVCLDLLRYLPVLKLTAMKSPRKYTCLPREKHEKKI